MTRGRLARPELPSLPTELAGWHWERQNHTHRLVYGSRWRTPWRDEDDGPGQVIAMARRAANVLSMEKDEMTVAEAEIIATVEAPLSTGEQQQLIDHEHTIERGLQTFYEVGSALTAIREERLYRATHPTFEEYSQARWGMTKSRANQLIAAADVVENLTTIVVKPQTESQARPLASLPPEEQPRVWQEAVDTAPDGKVTAAHVQATVNKAQGKPAPTPAKPAPTPTPTPPPPPLQLTPLPAATLPPPLALTVQIDDQAMLAIRKALAAKVVLLKYAYEQARRDLLRETQDWDQEVVIADEQARAAGTLFVQNPTLQGAAAMLAFAAQVQPITDEE